MNIKLEMVLKIREIMVTFWWRWLWDSSSIFILNRMRYPPTICQICVLSWTDPCDESCDFPPKSPNLKVLGWFISTVKILSPKRWTDRLEKSLRFSWGSFLGWSSWPFMRWARSTNFERPSGMDHFSWKKKDREVQLKTIQDKFMKTIENHNFCLIVLLLWKKRKLNSRLKYLELWSSCNKRHLSNLVGEPTMCHWSPHFIGTRNCHEFLWNKTRLLWLKGGEYVKDNDNTDHRNPYEIPILVTAGF